MTETKRIPAVAGLFSEEGNGPRLLGSRCSSCKTPYFPKDTVCHNPNCGNSSMEEASFGPRGKVWSFAVQNYAPPPPALTADPYEPYALGVIDLEDGLRVLGRIDVDDPMNVKVGGEVELVIGKVCDDDDGNDVVTWMFRPVQGTRSRGECTESKP